MTFVSPPKDRFSIRIDLPYDIFDDGNHLNLVRWKSITERGYKLEFDGDKNIIYNNERLRGVLWFGAQQSAQRTVPGRGVRVWLANKIIGLGWWLAERW